MSSYRIIFSLESLFKRDGQPDVGAATIYNFIAGHAQIVGKAIQDASLPDPIPYVDVISEREESERAGIVQKMDFFELMAPRALLLGNDDIGKDTILAVFDDDPERIKLWREIGAKCFSGRGDTTQLLVATP